MTANKQSFLDRLDAEALDLLRSAAHSINFRSGSVLVRQGQLAHGPYLLRSGSVEASIRLPSGDRVIVAELGAGDVFGDTAVVERGTYAATLSATTDVEAWFVEGADFRALTVQRSQAALKLQHAVTRLLTEKLRSLNQTALACRASEDRPTRPPMPAEPLRAVPRTKTARFEFRRFLPELPFFEGFSERDISTVVAHGALLDLPRGHAIFAAGEPALACYLVIRGAVEVINRYGDRERRMCVLGPGQLVGFMSVIDDACRSNEAYAREATLLLEIEREPLLALCFELNGPANRVQRAIHSSLLRSMAQTNRTLTRLMTEARLGGGRRRVDELEVAYSGQIVAAEEPAPAI